MRHEEIFADLESRELRLTWETETHEGLNHYRGGLVCMDVVVDVFQVSVEVPDRPVKEIASPRVLFDSHSVMSLPECIESAVCLPCTRRKSPLQVNHEVEYEGGRSRRAYRTSIPCVLEEFSDISRLLMKPLTLLDRVWKKMDCQMRGFLA